MSMLAAPCGNDPSWSKDVLRATLASAAAIISLLCDWVPSDGNAKPVSYWRVELPQTFLARLTGRGRNLAHLEPVIIACPAKAPQNQFTINVRYSKHCFTVAFDPRRHKPKWMIMDGKQARAFDEERFELSKLLAAMIAALPQADVNQTHERNYVYTIPTSRPDGRRLSDVLPDRARKVWYTLRSGIVRRKRLSVPDS